LLFVASALNSVLINLLLFSFASSVGFRVNDGRNLIACQSHGDEKMEEPFRFPFYPRLSREAKNNVTFHAAEMRHRDGT
jgi:hypothetical protein